ncbi:MAG: hypothetical protein EOO41_01510 [Methanobacteriota archaeon]|nr:MAG: hypothetical protein EOO41_01510 [Euryarchaeota archaeon]
MDELTMGHHWYRFVALFAQVHAELQPAAELVRSIRSASVALGVLLFAAIALLGYTVTRSEMRPRLLVCCRGAPRQEAPAARAYGEQASCSDVAVPAVPATVPALTPTAGVPSVLPARDVACLPSQAHAVLTSTPCEYDVHARWREWITAAAASAPCAREAHVFTPHGHSIIRVALTSRMELQEP